MSEFSRLMGVFVSPGEAFADIVKRPRWWIPVILVSLFSTMFIIAFSNRVGFEQMIRQALQQSSQGQNMSAEQMQQAITRGSQVLQVFSYGGAIISVTISVFVISVVLLFLFDTIMGADIGLKRLMGIVSYAYLPTIVSSMLAMLVMYLKPPEDFNLQNPLAFNAGAFLANDTSAWLKGLAGSLDLFSFWIIALMAIGAGAASRKMTFGKAFGTILFPWALYVLMKTGYLVLRG
jgi:hypothetical protein